MCECRGPEQSEEPQGGRCDVAGQTGRLGHVQGDCCVRDDGPSLGITALVPRQKQWSVGREGGEESDGPGLEPQLCRFLRVTLDVVSPL